MATIAVTGASGLIGTKLVATLAANGHTVKRLVRGDNTGPDAIRWDLDAHTIDQDGLNGVDAVVHLAGEPIGAKRWTAATKQRILDSRVTGTTLIASALTRLDTPPSVFVCGSAIGVYGDRGDEELSEDSARGDGFLADVVVAWEAAAQPAIDHGIRTVFARTGVVLAEGSPLIDKVRLPFLFGVGGRIGTGRQYVPWISLEDEIRALIYLIENDLSGPVNLTAPNPVTNAELTRAIGEVLRRPTVLPTHVAALRALYGEMGETLATVSNRVLPTRLTTSGFTFTHTDVRDALALAFNKSWPR
ncbi:MAG: TIGR01777 family oxidoreductase [Nitriliruptoraceae bacterium]